MIFIFLFLFIFAFCDENPGTTIASFLNIGSGARPEAVGGSFVAVANDGNAMYWNPAGIYQINKSIITGTYTAWFSDIKYSYIGIISKIEGNSFGFQFGFLHYGEFEEYGDEPNLIGKFYSYDFYTGISYSKEIFQNAGIGINLKYIHLNIASETSNGVSIDFGFLFKEDVFSFGILLQNIGPKMKFIDEYYPIPTNAKIGCSIFFEDNGFISFSIEVPIDNKIKFSTGIEFILEQIVAVRIGYFTRFKKEYEGGLLQNFTGITAGIGIVQKNYTIDYTFIPFGTLGNTHRISFSILF
jgi:hypothetical protein